MNALQIKNPRKSKVWLSSIWRMLKTKFVGCFFIFPWPRNVSRRSREMGYVSSVHYSVFQHHSPISFFPDSRGLRQGYLLSPYLIAIVGDSLSLIISKGVQNNLFSDFKVGWDNLMVSHLQYADYTILLLEADFTELGIWSTHFFSPINKRKFIR